MISLVETYFKPERGVSIPEVDRAYVELERAGFKLDVPYLNRKAALAREDADATMTTLRGKYAELGFHDDPDKIWSSPKQLDELVHDRLGLEPSPIWKKGGVALWKGERKLDGVALEYLANKNPEYRPFISEIVKLRRIKGCLKYLEKLPKFVDPTDGLVHPVYGPDSDDSESTGTNSGRTVMKNPEGQQIPSSEEKDPYDIRRGFIAPDGMVLVVRDYAAMEAVILHAICKSMFGDESLAGATDPNFHAINAQMVYGKYLGWHTPEGRAITDCGLKEFKSHPWLKDRRRDAKTVFYGLQFCKSARGFGDTLLGDDGCPIGEPAAGPIVDAFYEAIPALRKWQQWVWNYLLHRSGERFRPGVAAFSGRWREVTDLVDEGRRGDGGEWRFRRAWRQCCNHPIQGGGADVKVTALVYLQRELRRLGSSAVVQNDIHDELVVRCRPEEVAEVEAVMKWAMETTYPLPGGVQLSTAGSSGPTWADAK